MYNENIFEIVKTYQANIQKIFRKMCFLTCVLRGRLSQSIQFIDDF